ncbi:hypothetical protein [Ferruginibacter sp.]
MKKRWVTILIVLVVVALAMLRLSLTIKESMDERRASRRRQEEFNNVDESLQQSNDSINAANKKLLDSISIKMKQ